MSEFDQPSGRKSVTRASRAGVHARTLTEWGNLEGKVVTKPFLVLAVLALIGIIVIIYRYAAGLGAVTNLSDGFPWGIWITYDVLVGTALGCGGYAVAILVYAFNRWEYHPVVRSAVLTSVFGYSLAGLAIFLDIGRYWNGYKLFLPWTVNFNSVLVEVALCIAAYVVVLWIELLPTILEGYPGNAKAAETRRRLDRWLPVIAAVGILLPTMHQSSLGTLMILAGYKLSPLWQTGLLPFFFLMSAIAMGFAVTAFESILSSVAFKRPFETPMLSKLSEVMAWVVGGLPGRPVCRPALPGRPGLHQRLSDLHVPPGEPPLSGSRADPGQSLAPERPPLPFPGGRLHTPGGLALSVRRLYHRL